MPQLPSARARHRAARLAARRPGTVGIFTPRNGTWQASGPALPAALAGQDITVTRLTRTAQGMTAQLRDPGWRPSGASLLTPSGSRVLRSLAICILGRPVSESAD